MAREVLDLVWREADSRMRWRLAMVLATGAAASAAAALAPLALKLAMDSFAGQRNLGLSAVSCVGIYVLANAFARAIGEVRAYIHSLIRCRVDTLLGCRTFAHLLRLPFRFHLERQSGAVAQVLMSGLAGCQSVVQQVTVNFIPLAIEVVAVVAVFVHLGRAVFVGFFLGALLGYGIVYRSVVASTFNRVLSATRAHTDAYALMMDDLLNYETIKCYTAEPVVYGEFATALQHVESHWVGFFRFRTAASLLLAAMFGVFIAAMMLYAAIQVQHGMMTLGDFALINAYAFQMVRPIEQVGLSVQQLSEGAANLERLLEMLRQAPEEEAREEPPGSVAGELTFEDVSLSYGPGRRVLHHVSFQVPPGHTLGIVGTSGSGKSTLVRLVTRLIEPDSGRILLDGKPIRELPLRWLRERCAVVPQDTTLLNDTIQQNIGIGREGSSLEEIECAAASASLDGFIARLSERLRTRVGERGVKLSGGEKQRVSIARAALRKPRIYLLDEATSSLDSETERDIMARLREISRGSTTVIIAHRLSTLVHANEIIVLENGVVVERGSHAELLSRGGRYADLWEAQQATQAVSVEEPQIGASVAAPAGDNLGVC